MLSTAPNAQTIDPEERLDRPATSVPASQMPAELERMIAEAAYYIAEQRGFEPGHEIDDWLQAEAQVFDLIARGAR